MSEEKKDPDSGPLQFDRAEYAHAATQATCDFCRQAVHGVYYEINGKVACERCRADVEVGAKQGSGPGRFVRAAVFGLMAGAVGAAIWYGVRAATKYEVGLIAIVVGLMVGTAVRKGSNGRGGWLYQGLAMFLTYASIVSTYIPDIWQGIRAQANLDPAAATAAAPARPDAAATDPAPAGTPAAEQTPVAAEAEPAEGAERPARAAETAPGEKLPPGRALLTLVIGLVLLFALAFAAPFLAGFQNVIGIFIIGIAVYEAWKINKHVPLQITGPFRVGAARPAPTSGA